MKKKFMLRETGRQTRYFETLDAARMAMAERVTYHIGHNTLVKRINENRFEGYLDVKLFIAIKEYEVEG